MNSVLCGLVSCGSCCVVLAALERQRLGSSPLQVASRAVEKPPGQRRRRRPRLPVYRGWQRIQSRCQYSSVRSRKLNLRCWDGSGMGTTVFVKGILGKDQ